MEGHHLVRVKMGINRIGKQYNNAHRADQIVLAVLASIWLLIALMLGKDMNFGRQHRPSDVAGGGGPLALDGAAALVAADVKAQQEATKPLQTQKTYRGLHTAQYDDLFRDLQKCQQLHNRVALATRNSSTYQEVGTLQYVTASTHKAVSHDAIGDGSYSDGSNPYMVVVYNGTFFGQQWPTHEISCAVPCIMTSDSHRYRQRADVLVFHAAEIDTDNIQHFWHTPKPPQQLWALHSMESEEAYSIQQAASPIWEKVDIQATYKLSAVKPGVTHVPVPYLNSGEYGGFEAKRAAMYNKTGFALWMHNNCEAVSSRQVLIQQLMQLMPIDSPGSCLHNMDAQGMHTAAPTELMARYKFYFVFENVFGDPDWVSSTYFRALDAGAVPVVLGAPNVLKFAPGERSIIRACDFDSQQDLVDYLVYLDQNDTAYREYLAWKQTGPSPEFKSLMRAADVSPWCHMCVAAAARKPPLAFDAQTRLLIERHLDAKRAFDALNAQLDRESNVLCHGENAWWQVQLTAEEEAKLWAVDAQHNKT